jgi:hypothetical protein
MIMGIYKTLNSKEMIEEYEERKKWLLDRIGKRVFRESNGCTCKTCEAIIKDGIIIKDEMHAIYMLDMESISNSPEESNHPYKYRD